ncbi:hypothetical protein JCM3765_007672 [Sporobolomyces pararoseus]
MSFSKLARVAMVSITDTLLVLFPPTPLPLSLTSTRRNKQVLETVTTTTRTRTSAPRRSIEQELGFFQTVSYSLTGNYPESRNPSLPTRSTKPTRTYPSLQFQLEKNSHALSLEQPVKSCFRNCKANKLFSLPTSPSPSSDRPSSSDSSRRRVVFADPIDDGGNNPRHPRLVLAEAELEEEEEVKLEQRRFSSTRSQSPYRHCSTGSETPTLSVPKRRSTSSPPQSSCPNLPSSIRKQRAVAYSSPPQPSRRYSTRTVSSSSLPRPSPSRLRTPPLPGYEQRQRIVAYSF